MMIYIYIYIHIGLNAYRSVRRDRNIERDLLPRLSKFFAVPKFWGLSDIFKGLHLTTGEWLLSQKPFLYQNLLCFTVLEEIYLTSKRMLHNFWNQV